MAQDAANQTRKILQSQPKNTFVIGKAKPTRFTNSAQLFISGLWGSHTLDKLPTRNDPVSVYKLTHFWVSLTRNMCQNDTETAQTKAESVLKLTFTLTTSRARKCVKPWGPGIHG